MVLHMSPTHAKREGIDWVGEGHVQVRDGVE